MAISSSSTNKEINNFKKSSFSSVHTQVPIFAHCTSLPRHHPHSYPNVPTQTNGGLPGIPDTCSNLPQSFQFPQHSRQLSLFHFSSPSSLLIHYPYPLSLSSSFLPSFSTSLSLFSSSPLQCLICFLFESLDPSHSSIDLCIILFLIICDGQRSKFLKLT